MADINDDLIKDLERRANEQKGDIKDEDYEVEDIEAFLREQEGDDYVPPEPDPEPKVTVKQEVKQAQVTVKQNVAEKEKKKPVKEPDDLETRKGEIVDAKVEKKKEEKVDPRAKKKQGSTAAKAVERGRSPGLTFLLLFLKFVIFIVPILVAAWVVGLWLGSWVSTGWMLAVIALLSAILPGFILFIIVRKGRILWWMTALAVGLGALLLFLFPTISAESIIRHGHWPITAITEPMGASPDNFATRGINALDRSIATSLDPNVVNEKLVPLELGSADPLMPKDQPVDSLTEQGAAVGGAQPAPAPTPAPAQPAAQ